MAASGDKLTVVINHFKSKGSSCSSMADPEDTLGQGNCNRMRVAAAETLGQYMDEHFKDQNKDQNVLILGDLNAYAKEGPVLVLTRNDSRQTDKVVRDDQGQYSVVETRFRLGYQEVMEALYEKTPVSYVYDGEAGAMDHALASPSIMAKITRGQEWAINSVEMGTHDYTTAWKDAKDSEGVSWYDRMVNPDSPFRSSDHDPVMIDVNFDKDSGINTGDDTEGGSFGFPMLGLGMLSLFILRRRRKQLLAA